MSKSIKLISVLMIALVLTVCMPSEAFANNTPTSAGTTILESLEVDPTTVTTDAANVTVLAGRIISFIQYAAIIGGAIILAALGVKYMMGSVEEKAEYKKSFIPLIIGVVVVMGAVSIAKLVFNVFSGI